MKRLLFVLRALVFAFALLATAGLVIPGSVVAPVIPPILFPSHSWAMFFLGVVILVIVQVVPFAIIGYNERKEPPNA